MSGGGTYQGEERLAGGQPGVGQPEGSRSRLDSLPTGTRTTGEQAIARSLLVRRLRVALPVLALVLAATFFFNTKSNNVDDAFLDDFKDMSASADDLKMANPKFAGIDDNGQPFEITALTAMQVSGNQETVELEMPRAVQGKGSEVSIVTAQKGLYQSKNNVLELEQDVTLSHNLGAKTYILRVPAATVAINEEKVTSDTGVNGTGSDGSTLSADRMTAFNADRRIVFEGNVRMRIYPDTVKSSNDDADVRTEPETKGPETGGEENTQQ